MTPLNINDDHFSDGLKLRKVEDRIQLLEDLFKTYYINDEIFQKLNEATQHDAKMNGHGEKQVTNESGSTSTYYEDEEAPIYQTDQRKKI
jgi:hypothetical protein